MTKFKKWIKSLFRPVVRCSICHRPLTDEQDRRLGIGKACLKKQQEAAHAAEVTHNA